MNASINQVPLVWRAARALDLRRIDNVMNECHVNDERFEIVVERHTLFPDGVWALREGPDIVGCAVFYPWLLGAPPGVDQLIGRLPAAPDCLFVHDIAILPRARYRGSVESFGEILWATADRLGLRAVSCVSLYDHLHPIWAARGFVSLEVAIDPRYGPEARYMEKVVGG